MTWAEQRDRFSYTRFSDISKAETTTSINLAYGRALDSFSLHASIQGQT